ncbi:hypothetical protein EYC84_010864 [Monilinia fructicola]|uniref:Uncharacterized protein n=1 Tax=Monilinia fructicola TaxID=38448 RepID=A0A5M9JD13_MONFR|nr:hypothetical protein EYC84_010864 [Monilinia fructicola]
MHQMVQAKRNREMQETSTPLKIIPSKSFLIARFRRVDLIHTTKRNPNLPNANTPLPTSLINITRHTAR